MLQMKIQRRCRHRLSTIARGAFPPFPRRTIKISDWEYFLHRNLWLPDERARFREGDRHAGGTRAIAQVETPEAAELVLYNTCSIRDKAEQKVFNRLHSSSARGQGQGVRRAGLRGAAGRREDFRTRAARQPGLRIGQLHPAAGDAGAARSGQPARHRPEPGYRGDLRHALHAPRQSAPRVHHDHRRLRQILRLLRGAVHARSGAQPHQRERHGRSAASWPRSGYTEIQLLGQNVNSYRDPSPAGWDFATLLARVGEVPGIRRVRFTTSHPRDFAQSHRGCHRCEPDSLQSRAPAGAIRLEPRAGSHAAALHARRIHASGSTG